MLAGCNLPSDLVPFHSYFLYFGVEDGQDGSDIVLRVMGKRNVFKDGGYIVLLVAV